MIQEQFKENSIIVLNIKFGVKKKSIKSIFSRFGEICKIKTKESKNKTLMAFIKYTCKKSVDKALNYDEINCCGIPLTIRKAFSNQNGHKRCNCIICDRELLDSLKKVQNDLFSAIKQLHRSNSQGMDQTEAKTIRKELKATSKRLYKKIKRSIKS